MNQPEDIFPPGGSSAHESGRKSALDWAQRKGVTTDVMTELTMLSRQRRRRQHLVLLTSTAALGLFVLGGIFWSHHPQAVRENPLSATVVIVGPTRQILTDGTVVEWKDEAVRTVEFTPSVRRIVQRRGTAHYKVVKDATRPFVVEVEGLQVRAVGTAFSVQIEPTGVEVLVTEGKVEVTSMNPISDPTTRRPNALVRAGEHIKVDTNALATNRSGFSVTPLTAEALAEYMTWRIPRLEFSGTRLVEAAALFNQHNRCQLVLTDPSLENLQISGILRADNLTALLSLLRTDFGIEAEQRGENEILLRRAR